MQLFLIYISYYLYSYQLYDDPNKFCLFDNIKYYLDNTFGKENSDKYYLTLSEIYSNEKVLVINEVSGNKNSVEIKNISQEKVNLAKIINPYSKLYEIKDPKI